MPFCVEEMEVKRLMKSDESRPTGKKLQMAELLASPEFNGTNKELYEAIGISHDTFYKWIKDPDILNYAGELIDKYTDAELSRVWKALINRCAIGDVQAIKLYFELKGKYKQSVDVENSGTIQIVIDKDADDYAG